MIPGRVYTPATVLVILRRRFWLIAVSLVLSMGVAVAIAKGMPDIYATQTVILAVPPPVPATVAKPAAPESLEYRLLSITPQILNPERLERIIIELDLYPEMRRVAPISQAIETMRGSIMGPRVIRPDAFAIGYYGYWPHRVMQVTERLAALFIDENMKNREKRAADNSDFFGSQLEDTGRRLREQEQALQQYRTKHAASLPSQIAANLQVLKTTQDQAQVLQDTLSRDRERRSELEQVLIEAQRQVESTLEDPTDTPPAADAEPTAAATDAAPADPAVPAPAKPPAAGAPAEAANNPDVNFGPPGTPAAVRLQNARRYLDGLRVRGLLPAHPEVVRAQKIVDQLEKSAAEQTLAAKGRPAPGSPVAHARAASLTAAQRRLAALDKEIANKTADYTRLRQAIADYQSRVESGPAHEAKLIELTRDYDILNDKYKGLLAKKEELSTAADLERQHAGELFRIIEPARVPSRPTSPNRRSIVLIGSGIGLVFGLAMTVLLELRDQSFRSAPEVFDLLSLPVLAMVPAMSTRYDRRRWMRRLTVGAFLLVFMAMLGSGLLALRSWW